jgi:cobalt-zinc-cadmium efflux system membrane fusion protein
MKNTIIILVILSLITCGKGDLPVNENHNHVQEQMAGPETHKISGKNQEKDIHESGQHGEHKTIRVAQEKQTSWGIRVDTVYTQNISSRITLPGVIVLNENRTAYITSFVNGQITQISADLGDGVKKGQNLLTVNSPEFAQAQADFLETRAKYNLSRKEFERAARLRNEKAIEEKEYLRREAEHEKLTMEYAALGSKLHSFGITHAQIEKMIEKCSELEEEEYKCELADPHLSILSPISGTVISRNAIIGDFIEPGNILFTVSDLGILWAHLDAYEKDIPFIHRESGVVIRAPLYKNRTFKGKIVYISDVIDEKLRTVKVRVEVENNDRLLKPNMYIQGLIENESQDQEIIAIPEEAVQTLEGQKIVFVPEGEEMFRVKPVQTGDKIEDQIIINAGLKEGDSIVVKGAFTLKTEFSKSTYGHVHTH